MHRTVIVAVIVAVAALGACSDRDTPDPGAPVGRQDLAREPEVDVPRDTPAPTELVIEDLVTGDGAEATLGTTLQVHYVGVAWSTGEEFDSSWGRQPFQLELGAGDVIAGWDQGLVGMRVGGRRQLTIPPRLGYGGTGVPGVIEPDETLLFVVDLLAVSR